MKIFISADQWIEPTANGIRYHDGVHRGFENTLQEALESCQSRYDYARGIRDRPRGEHVYGRVALPYGPYAK